VKYLGIFIDDELKWCEHIKHVYNKIKQYVVMFYKIRQKLSPVCLKNLYFATVYPHIQYGIELYANTNITFLCNLSVQNNKILRILQFKTSTCAVRELYDTFSTLQIGDLHEFKLLILMHKYFHDSVSLPSAFQNYFTMNTLIHSHNTRTHDNIHINFFNTRFGSCCLNFHGSKLWNSLPNHLKCIASPNAFKRELKKIY